MDELIGLTVGFLLTLFIYSYIWRDNPLYRLAVHLLVGVSAAYAAVVVIQAVLAPVMVELIEAGTAASHWFIPLFLVFLLFLKLVRPVAWLGNSATAFLVGVGAAVALVGAIVGSLLPQVMASYATPALGIIIAPLTICTLLYFHFTGRLTADGQVVLPFWQRYPALIGQVVITITFGALFAGALNTSIVLLAGRIAFFIERFTVVFDQFLS
jgi:hypothetical protein